MTTDAFGRASWMLLVLFALAVIPVPFIRAVVGVRPVAAAPDVTSLELAAGIGHRSPTYTSLTSDMIV